MTDYIETQTTDGGVVRIEVAADTKSGAGFGRQESSGDVSSEAAKAAYSQTLETIRTYATGVIQTIRDLETQPSAASIDFSIKIDSKAGAMIAKSLGEGQFKVSLSWRQAEPEAKPDKSE